MSRIDERRKQARADPSAEYEQKRAALVEVAAHIFKRRGFGGTSINDIAAESGTDRGTVYYYFADKRELFHAVILDAVQHSVDTAAEIARSEAPAAEKVRTLLTALMKDFEEHYPYLYVYIQEDMAKIGQDETESSRKLRDLQRRYNTLVESMIKQGIDAGEFKPGLDPRLVAYTVLGAVNWTHRWFTPGRARPTTEVVNVMAEILLGGMVAPAVPGR